MTSHRSFLHDDLNIWQEIILGEVLSLKNNNTLQNKEGHFLEDNLHEILQHMEHLVKDIPDSWLEEILITLNLNHSVYFKN